MKVHLTAPQFSIDWNDVIKGLKMAVILPVLTIIYTSLSAGSFQFDWHGIAIAAAGGLTAYLIKNFFDPQQAVIRDRAIVEDLKDGVSSVEIAPK